MGSTKIELAIFGYSIRNILCVLVVLVLGWQNGILIGATSGVTIGVVIAIIQNGDPVQIAAFAISGMIAGLLNKIGKIGVIIGFLLGNIILWKYTFYNNGTRNFNCINRITCNAKEHKD